jgi:hypothetical protein
MEKRRAPDKLKLFLVLGSLFSDTNPSHHEGGKMLKNVSHRLIYFFMNIRKETVAPEYPHKSKLFSVIDTFNVSNLPIIVLFKT